MSEAICPRCAGLVSDFRFFELAADDPPQLPPKEDGVYGIRVVRRGNPVSDVIETVTSLLAPIPWGRLRSSINGQISRLSAIGNCNLLYLGMGRELYSRWDQLTWSHPAMIPLIALLCHGWQCEFGWLVCDKPAEMEHELKRIYKLTHHTRLPALMRR
jgi:hypothetical protein